MRGWLQARIGLWNRYAETFFSTVWNGRPPSMGTSFDFRKALGIGIREELQVIMQEDSIPSVYINIIRGLYKSELKLHPRGWKNIRLVGGEKRCVRVVLGRASFVVIVVIDWVKGKTLCKRRKLR